MRVQILRGKEHIGGNIIKISEGDTAILLDCGAMLPEIGGPKTEDDFDMAKIGRVDALFLSHHHGDHSGLLDKLPAAVDLYASPETITYLDSFDLYLDKPLRTGGRRVRGLFDGEDVQVGSLRVTAYHAEHSAEGAVMFLVEGGGKRLLYTGDFQSKPDFPANKIDLLITEGTMLTRDAQAYPDEDAVEMALRRIMRETEGRVFVLQSSANLPRLRSVIAARNNVSPDKPIYAGLSGTAATPPRPLMQDVFMKFMLEETGHKELAAPYAFVWEGFDQDSDRVCKLLARRYWDMGAAASCRCMIQLFNAVIFLRSSMLSMMKSLIAKGMDISNDALVFSTWRGYEKDPQTAALLALFAAHGVEPQYIHTSGHANRKHLKALIDDVKPAKVACIHSEDASGIAELCGEGIAVVDGDDIQL